VRIRSNDSVDKIVAALANPPPQTEAQRLAEVVERLPTEQKMLRSVLMKSFQAHQKGELREHCTLGHKLEQPILEKWVLEMQTRDFPLRFLKVRGAYMAGLVQKKDAPWVKDSIDFILSVQDVILGKDEDDIEL